MGSRSERGSTVKEPPAQPGGRGDRPGGHLSPAAAAGGPDLAAPRPLDPAIAGDHIDRLYRAAWGLCGNREDAEDLVQETYLRVLSRPRLLSRSDELAYLLRALRNTFINQRRRARVEPIPLAEPPEQAEARSALMPNEAAEASELLDTVSALRAEFRDVLVAVDLVGLSYQQAARALGLRTGTVKSRLHRARRELLGVLDADGERWRPIPRAARSG